jgi:hypothetical protein
MRRCTSVLSPKYEVYCCDQNGPSARREEGAYLNRYVTDEQRGRRPIFIATLWAGASWLFFRVARSTRMTQIWALRSRLEKQPTYRRQYTSYFGDRTLGRRQSHERPRVNRLTILHGDPGTANRQKVVRSDASERLRHRTAEKVLDRRGNTGHHRVGIAILHDLLESLEGRPDFQVRFVSSIPALRDQG